MYKIIRFDVKLNFCMLCVQLYFTLLLHVLLHYHLHHIIIISNILWFTTISQYNTTIKFIFFILPWLF